MNRKKVRKSRKNMKVIVERKRKKRIIRCKKRVKKTNIKLLKRKRK